MASITLPTHVFRNHTPESTDLVLVGGLDPVALTDAETFSRWNDEWDAMRPEARAKLSLDFPGQGAIASAAYSGEPPSWLPTP